MNEKSDMAYVAIAPCGCCVVAMVDKPRVMKDGASELARCLREGLRVEHVTAEWVRTESRWGCDACKTLAQQELAL